MKAQDVEHGPDGKFRPASLRTIIARAVLAVLEKPDGVETLDWQIADAVIAAQADASGGEDKRLPRELADREPDHGQYASLSDGKHGDKDQTQIGLDKPDPDSI